MKWLALGLCVMACTRDAKALALGLCLMACTRDVRPEHSPPLHDHTFVVWDGKTGARLTQGEVVERLAAVDVVLVGEEHGQRDFHDTQRDVARALLPLGLKALAVEWITWANRGAIEHSTIETVAGDLRWEDTWGHDFMAYRDVFAWAFAHDVPIVGVNARREVARALSKGGRDGVPAELAAELTPLTSGTDAHRAWFAGRMASAHHPMPPDALERYYLAQLLWDETMAAHIDALAERGKVLGLAGLGHTERALGIAHRLRSSYLIVRPVADEADARAHARDAEYPEREADLLWRVPR